jgi:succinoglycan biosynthesis transport protein ExoP
MGDQPYDSALDAIPGAATPVVAQRMPTPEADEERPSGRSLSLGVFWRYKWTILIVAMLVAPAGVAAVWMLHRPEFRSTALIHVRSKLHHLVETHDGTGQIPQYERYLLSQAEIIKSSAVLERLLDRKDVRETFWFRNGQAPEGATQAPANPIEWLTEALIAGPVRKTELVQISVSTARPTDAATIVNALVDEYVKFANEQFTDEDRMLLDELKEDERKLIASIALSEQAASEARRKLGTGASADDLISQQRVRLDEMQGELSQVTLQIGVVNQQIEDLKAEGKGAGDDGEDAEEDTAVDYRRDEEWRRLNAAVEDVESRLAQAADQLRSKHPARIRLEAELEFAKRRRAEREASLDETGVAGIVALPTPMGVTDGEALFSVPALKRQLQQLQIKQRLVGETVERLSQDYASDFEAAESLRSETNKVARFTERLQLVQQRQRELIEKGRVPPSIKVISKARAATSPDNSDKRLKMMLAAVCAAFAAGVAAAYVRFLMDPRVADTGDVRQSYEGVFLGYLPLAKEGEAEHHDATPALLEAVRVVRTALLNRLDGTTSQVVQITSADQGSGKSTVAILIARSLAKLGKRVLLVDADIRRPSLARRLELEGRPGLLTALRGQGGDRNGLLSATDIPNLTVVTSGGIGGPDDVELLANGHFSAMLNDWRRGYDFTILDSPPLVGAADAAILSQKADATMLVVRERHCRRASLAEGLAMLQAAGGRVLGTVFLGSNRQREYYYSSYGFAADAPHAVEAEASRQLEAH